jgi:putative tryptophan/tyrosine transport system substrate-binding protein
MTMNRRAFIPVIAAALTMCPTRAQQARILRTVGVLMGLAKDEETEARANLIEEGLAKRGWIVGQNLRIEYRFAASSPRRILGFARELVDLQPDVIVGHSTPVVAALHQITRAIPIVFVVVGDPVGSGFVKSLARPGGNITGFSVMWPTITGKYLSILREMNPDLNRVALMFNADTGPEREILPNGGALAMRTFEESAKEFHVTPILAQLHSPTEIETVMDELGATSGSAIIVMPGNFTTLHRERIISLAARLRIPAIYPYRYFADEGGLLSYGVDVLDLFRRAPDYVDRILRGANPADLPVQAPRKFELAINLKTARLLGLTVPRILLAGADKLID